MVCVRMDAADYQPGSVYGITGRDLPSRHPLDILSSHIHIPRPLAPLDTKSLTFTPTATILSAIFAIPRRLFGSFSPNSAQAIMSAKTKAQTLIDSNPAVVFSKSYCPYCKATKELLQRTGAKYEVLELDQIGESPYLFSVPFSSSRAGRMGGKRGGRGLTITKTTARPSRTPCRKSPTSAACRTSSSASSTLAATATFRPSRPTT